MHPLIPIAILLLISLGLCAAILGITSILGPKNPTSAKLGTYECGVRPEGSARTPFKSRFYLVAVLFLLFDVEGAFLLPWALVYRESIAEGPGLLIAGILYLGLTALGLVYVLRKGCLKLN